MYINRRLALRQMLIISAGAALLPACVNNEKRSAHTFTHLPITAEEEALMEDIAATIIPTTDTPGAKEVSAHLFVLQMINDCYKQEDQVKFLKGLRQFRDEAKKQYGRSFEKCTVQQKEALLEKPGEGDAGYFCGMFKYLTIQAYTNSEYYLTKVHVYKLIPGKFTGSVKI